jgi:hypothetical protein
VLRCAINAAGNNFGPLNRSPRTIMAKAMRAILLASAIAAGIPLVMRGRTPQVALPVSQTASAASSGQPIARLARFAA